MTPGAAIRCARGWIMAVWRFSAAASFCAPPSLNGVTGSIGNTLGLAIYREFGDEGTRGLVFFLGNGLLEVSGTSTEPSRHSIALWIQVRHILAEHQRLLGARVTIFREPRREAWGLMEMWIADPDGVRIVLVEIPEDHPLRRDQRHLAAGNE